MIEPIIQAQKLFKQMSNSLCIFDVVEDISKGFDIGSGTKFLTLQIYLFFSVGCPIDDWE